MNIVYLVYRDVEENIMEATGLLAGESSAGVVIKSANLLKGKSILYYPTLTIQYEDIKYIKRFKVDNPSNVTLYCVCPCHYNKTIMHLYQCCEGQCSNCHQRVVKGLKDHEEICGIW